LRTGRSIHHVYEQLDEVGQSHIQNLLDSSLQMNHHLEGLLALSRSMNKKLESEAINLTRLTEDIKLSLEAEEPERQVSFHIEAEMQIYGDIILIRTFMEHLIDNAWKFTASKEEAIIRVSSEVHDGETNYKISDNGVGFDMSHKEMLFRPFYSLHSPGEHEGSGVGLALSQQIIERHGGKIWADAEVGKGATFFFTVAQKYRQP
jgi:light-regulated signal transduction histidine kinase (bacteriophytochrome)